MGGIRGLERSAILAAALLVAGCGYSGSSPQTSVSEASARATNTARPSPSATPGQASPSGSLPPGVTVVDTANVVQRLDWSPDGELLAVLTWGAVFGNGRADILDLAGHTIGSFDAFDMAWMDDARLMTFDVTPNDTAHGTVALHSTDGTESAILPGTFGGMLGNGHGSVALMAPVIGSSFATDVSFRIWCGGQLGQSISGFGEPVVWSPDGRLLALISESPTGSGGIGGPIPGTLTVLQLPSRSVVLAHQFTDVRMDVYLSPDDSKLATSDGSVLNLTDPSAVQPCGCGGLDLAWPVAVARAAGRWRPFETGSPQKPLDLVLNRPLDNELGAQATEPAQPVEVVDIALAFESVEQQLFDLGLDLDTRGHPCLHGVVLLRELPKVRFGAYAVFTFTAVSGRHPPVKSRRPVRLCPAVGTMHPGHTCVGSHRARGSPSVGHGDFLSFGRGNALVVKRPRGIEAPAPVSTTTLAPEIALGILTPAPQDG